MEPLVSFLLKNNIIKEDKRVTAMEKHGGKNSMGKSKHSGWQSYAEVFMFDLTLIFENNETKTYTADMFGRYKKNKFSIHEFNLKGIKSISARFIIDYGFYEEDDDRSWEYSNGDCEVLWKRNFDGLEFIEEWESVRPFKGNKKYKDYIKEAMNHTFKSMFSDYYKYNKIEDEKAFEKAVF